jgi:uncharacterized protein with von Willebrand factor type A (vWA) domain
MSDLATLTAAFGRLLRTSDVPVTTERSARFAAVVSLARPVTVSELYWLARVTLVDGPEQLEAFDAAFRYVFAGIDDPAEFRGEFAAPPTVVLAPTPTRPGTDRRRSPGVVPGEATLPGSASSTQPSGTSSGEWMTPPSFGVSSPHRRPSCRCQLRRDPEPTAGTPVASCQVKPPCLGRQVRRSSPPRAACPSRCLPPRAPRSDCAAKTSPPARPRSWLGCES